jgi:hypothetical protein
VARWLIIAGLGLAALGAVLLYAPWLVRWFGRLPGDLRFETERTRVYVPIVSMALLSVVISLLLSIFRR